jgi:hypothetical protein
MAEFAPSDRELAESPWPRVHFEGPPAPARGPWPESVVRHCQPRRLRWRSGPGAQNYARQ